MTASALSLQPIGIIHSCYKEKFGIPRQPRLVPAARAELHLLPEYAVPESVRGLEAFSHIWLIFCFHVTQAQGWHPTVRPPRLGGNQRMGVFASRSTFRPNPIGLSLVKLDKVYAQDGCVYLALSGIDLVDGTPVLDIKPYIPYADEVADAVAGYASEAPATCSVSFSALALAQCAAKTQQWATDIRQLIEQILAQDPRPAYQARAASTRVYAMKLYDFDLRWRYSGQGIEVLELAEPE